MKKKKRSINLKTGQRNSPKQRSKKKKINKSRLRDLWDNKGTEIHIIGVTKEEDRNKGEDNLFEEIITDNFSNLEEKSRH